ncbi:Protein AIM2 [Grifola frondosa]|uniref:Protein AIM2 n=1 Tax=Grifola frondosa TaxID=5627 RepID=A0A1C7MB51_GRIFR|nr:Protein AIM2 [Grifola frondosa]
MSLCKHCVSGVRHEGTSEGKIEQIGGVECYVATPTVDYPKDKVVLFLTDVFGIQLPNNPLLADDYARNGFKVVIPDIVGVRKVIAALRESGVTKFGALGFCYGARPCFDLAFTNEVAVVAVAHPSLLQVPADFVRYKAESKAPLLINTCEIDSIFPAEAQATADEFFGEGKFAPGYQRVHWDGCTHGFAVRGDMSDPTVKAGKEGAFKASVEWLIKYL